MQQRQRCGCVGGSNLAASAAAMWVQEQEQGRYDVGSDVDATVAAMQMQWWQRYGCDGGSNVDVTTAAMWVQRREQFSCDGGSDVGARAAATQMRRRQLNIWQRWIHQKQMAEEGGKYWDG